MSLRLFRAAALATLGLVGPALGQSAQPKRLVFAAVATPSVYDPELFVPGVLETLANVYEGMFQYVAKAGAPGDVPQADVTNVRPHLAESYEVSPDGLTIKVKLRQGIRSFFNNELTSQDVVWAWERSMAAGRNGAFNQRMGSFASISAPSRYEIEYKLSAPSRIFLIALANSSPAIFDSTEVRKHATTEDPYANAWISRNTAGFGPYHMQSSKPGEGAVFVANPNYFRPQPYYQQVIYREVPSPAARAALIKSGQAQWAEAMPMQQLIDLMKDPKVKVLSVPGLGSATLRMNPKYPPFDDIRVRKAIEYATDYEAIGRVVFEGRSRRSYSILAPEIAGSIKASAYETDIPRARALLTEAGHPDGIDAELYYSANFWWEESLAIVERDALAKAGIRLALKRITQVEMAARRAPGVNSLPFLTHATNPSVADAGFALALSAQTRGVTNVHGYSSPELDKLIEQIKTEREDGRWRSLVAQAQRVVADDATYVETYFPGVYEVMAPCMDGYFWTPINRPKWYPLNCK